MSVGSGGESRFDSSRSEDELWEELLTFVGDRLGATSCLYGFVPTVHVMELEPVTRSLVLRHNHPSHPDADYSPDTLLSEDPSTLRLIQDIPWFYWRDSLDWEGVTEAQRRRYARDGKAGLSVGISVRFSFFDGRGLAGVGIAASNSSQEEFEQAWESQIDVVLPALHRFDAVMRPRMIENRFALPPREKEFLALMAGGLSAKQISNRVGLAEKTVQNTIERVRKRLQASNSVEAVTKALAFKLI